jgi:hypothetical protein
MAYRDSLLIASAACSIVVALLHVVVIAQGAPAYRYFGAGERLASLAEQGSWWPALITSGITGVFLVFAAYYLAAAGVLPKLPGLAWGLIGIAAVYSLRGALLIPVWLTGRALSPFEVASSLISLSIGLLHVAAVWAFLRPPSALLGRLP